MDYVAQQVPPAHYKFALTGHRALPLVCRAHWAGMIGFDAKTGHKAEAAKANSQVSEWPVGKYVELFGAYSERLRVQDKAPC